MKELSDVPGRERDLDQLVGGCRAISTNRGGRLLFVFGGPASSREALLGALVDELEAASEKSRVFAGRFVGRRYEPGRKDPTAIQQLLASIKHLGEVGEWIAGPAGPIGVGVPDAQSYSDCAAGPRAKQPPLELLEGLRSRPEPP